MQISFHNYLARNRNILTFLNIYYLYSIQLYKLNFIFSYYPPDSPGYNTEMFEKSVKDYTYPNGKIWKDLFQSGKYTDPSRVHKRLF